MKIDWLDACGCNVENGLTVENGTRKNAEFGSYDRPIPVKTDLKHYEVALLRKDWPFGKNIH